MIKDPGTRDDHLIRLEHGQPITFGSQGQFSVVHPAGGFGLSVRETANLGGETPVVHDATVDDPAYAFALSRLSGSDLNTTPIGVFRSVERPSYDEILQKQLVDAKAQATGTPEQMLGDLLNAGDTWTIL
jgi:2-oxoglutarate ferredoxin oxidoreductase subunit beta